MPPQPAELRAHFQGQQPKPRTGKAIRLWIDGVGAMALALFCMYTLVTSLKDGAGMGVWLIALAVGMGCAWLTFDLSRRDMTRWTRLTFSVGALAVTTGHLLAANSVA